MASACLKIINQMLGYMENTVILVDELRYSAIRRYVIYDTFKGFFVPLNTFSSELFSYYAFFLFFQDRQYIFFLPHVKFTCNCQIPMSKSNQDNSCSPGLGLPQGLESLYRG